MRAAAARALDHVSSYPDPFARELCARIAEQHDIEAESILCGNGSSELFAGVLRALDATRALIPSPAYIGYREAADAVGLPVVALPLNGEYEVDWPGLAGELVSGDVVLLGHPANPTGRLLNKDVLCKVCSEHPGCHFLVDESFLDFVADGAERSLVSGRPDNVTVLRSMTKFYAIPGLRLGYMVGAPALVDAARRQLPPWSVNGPAQSVGLSVLADAKYAERSRRLTALWRSELKAGVEALGVSVVPAVANYLLCHVPSARGDAAGLCEALLAHRIAIRACADFDGLDGRAFRVAVRTPHENGRLLDALQSVWGKAAPRPSRRTPALMLQGTASGVGKSLLAAGLCRVLRQDGIRVAPFKAQNMALNSYVTADGKEMGRSQVTQASACGLAPDVRMNPLLLKPMGASGCQVVLEGKAIGVWTGMEQHHERKKLEDAIDRSYASLSAEFDAIVLEGAGSPAEINLKDRDLVNMAMARKAQSPVLLVGDIDRGGVYASLIGTMETFDDWERQLVAGFIVNRLRGQAAGLAPANVHLEQRCGKPVLGVVPFLNDLHLPEEDSVTFGVGRYHRKAQREDALDIAVIALPHISNFTDLDPLLIEPDVGLRSVSSPRDLGTPHAVILPGSKNTTADLQMLMDTGLAPAIAELAAGDCMVVGVCAGMQMLGRHVLDESDVEGGSGRGLGLLPVRTVMMKEKTLRQTTATHLLSGLPVKGYEIHHGQTTSSGDVAVAMKTDDGNAVGYASPDGSVWGTYLHGVFDGDAFRSWFLNDLRRRRGLSPIERSAGVYGLEPALDRLAEAVREHLDMKRIYRIMGL
jgi:cobyric acid synthase CobQ